MPTGVGRAFLHHSGLEKSFEQIENLPIGDFGGHAGHNDLVRNVVEEPLNVGVEYVNVSLPMEFQHPLDGLMAIAAWSETIRVVMKQPLEEPRVTRTQKLPQHLLGNAVADGWNPQGTKLPLGM